MATTKTQCTSHDSFQKPQQTSFNLQEIKQDELSNALWTPIMSYYKKHKRGSSAFVILHHWMINCDAWRNLKPAPRALYIDLKRRFNGYNNGDIFLSHREASFLLNVHRNSVGGYFKQLQDHGFIKQTQMPYLGPSGIGLSGKWALTEESLNGKPATKEFMRWCKI